MYVNCAPTPLYYFMVYTVQVYFLQCYYFDIHPKLYTYNTAALLVLLWCLYRKIILIIFPVEVTYYAVYCVSFSLCIATPPHHQEHIIVIEYCINCTTILRYCLQYNYTDSDINCMVLYTQVGVEEGRGNLLCSDVYCRS